MVKLYAGRALFDGMRGALHSTPDSILWRGACMSAEPAAPAASALLVLYASKLRGRPQELPRDTKMDSPFELLHYASQRLTQLRALERNWDDDNGQPPTDDAVITMYEVLRGIADRRTVFPFLSPTGDGGLMAEWHAVGQILEIQVEPDGTAYLYGKDSRGETTIDGEATEEARRRFRRLLVALSLYVNRENPTWRKLFK